MGPKRQGSSIIEFALIMPWFVFLFVGVLDLGFYTYALITAQSAARTAVLFTSSSTSASTQSDLACSHVIDQLTPNINLSGSSTCGGTSPITLTTSVASTTDGHPSSTVTVQFTSPLMIPIPGILPAHVPIVRTAQMIIGR